MLFSFPIKILGRREFVELTKTNCRLINHSAQGKVVALVKSTIYFLCNSLQSFRTLSYVWDRVIEFLLYALAYFAAGECIEPTIIIVRVGCNNSSDHSQLDRQTDRQTVGLSWARQAKSFVCPVSLWSLPDNWMFVFFFAVTKVKSEWIN